jgi:hypothetical protein
MTLSWKTLTTPALLAGSLAAIWALAPGCAPAADEPHVGGGAPAGALVVPSFEEFRATVYREPWPGGHYVVEGDLPMRDDDELRAYYDGVRFGETAVVIGTENGRDVMLSAERRVDLSYCLDQTFSVAERDTTLQALRIAALRWEAVSDVHFVYKPEQDANCTTNNTNIYFVVTRVQSNGDPYFAKAFFPNFDQANRKLNIDALAFDPQRASVFDDVMTHEFGHILGFRHEHGRKEATRLNPQLCEETNTGWRAITPYDADSVMAYSECTKGSPGEFKMSLRDEEGALALYGAPGRRQPVEGTQVSYRTPTFATKTLNPLTISLLRARAGSTVVVVLKSASENDITNLYVRLDKPVEDTQTDGCRSGVNATGVPQVCRLAIPTDRDAQVFIGVKAVPVSSADPQVDAGLSVVYVQAL